MAAGVMRHGQGALTQRERYGEARCYVLIIRQARRGGNHRSE
jgi:hypothetical protein